MSKVSSFIIDTSLMPEAETSRKIKVLCKKDAEFFLIATQDGTIKFYNWNTDTFEDGHKPKNNFKVKATGTSFNKNIIFPSGGGTYVIKLITFENTFFKRNKRVVSKTIEKQSSDSIITFTPFTTSTANYQTFPTLQVTGSPEDTADVSKIFSILNASDDTGGFGFRYKDVAGFSGLLLRDAVNSGELGLSELSSLLFFTNHTGVISINPSGDGEDTSSLIMNDVSGFVVGQELRFMTGTSTPTNKAGAAVTDVFVKSIDPKNNLIGFTEEVVFTAGNTITVKSLGAKQIFKQTGLQFKLSAVTLLSKDVLKTVRTDTAGNVDVNISDTHGIGGGRISGLTVEGLGVINPDDGSNSVDIVTPDCPDLTSGGALDNDGVIRFTVAQTLEQGTLLTFRNTFNKIDLQIGVKISIFPNSNITVNINLDNFLIPGVSGS
tara:strand:+ start:682 stop:1986 length:1305 start_codon:yes stop_codon:yes gene_type:complete